MKSTSILGNAQQILKNHEGSVESKDVSRLIPTKSFRIIVNQKDLEQTVSNRFLIFLLLFLCLMIFTKNDEGSSHPVVD